MLDLRQAGAEKTSDVDRDRSAGADCSLLPLCFRAAAEIAVFKPAVAAYPFDIGLHRAGACGEYKADIGAAAQRCLGWALCATTAGMLFSINPEWVFWMGSAAALLLVSTSSADGTCAPPFLNRSPGDWRRASPLPARTDWYVIGVACVYDVFDQQFATFFKSFFATPEAGTRACAPPFLNRSPGDWRRASPLPARTDWPAVWR
jgi:hypothetical protein